MRWASSRFDPLVVTPTNGFTAGRPAGGPFIPASFVFFAGQFRRRLDELVSYQHLGVVHCLARQWNSGRRRIGQCDGDCEFRRQQPVGGILFRDVVVQQREHARRPDLSLGTGRGFGADLEQRRQRHQRRARWERHLGGSKRRRRHELVERRQCSVE